MRKSKTEERIRDIRRQTFNRRKKKVKFIFTIILLIILLYGIINFKKATTNFLWKIKSFNLKNVVITPERYRFLITDLIEIERVSNLLFLNIDELRDKILMIQEVEECKIEKKYPSTLKIQLLIRQPWVVVANKGDTFFIDRKGKIIYPMNKSIPVFTKVENLSVSNGEVVEKDFWKLKTLKEIEDGSNVINLPKYVNLEKIIIFDKNEILISGDNKKIMVSEDNISEKFKLLKLILEENVQNQKNWKYIDMRFESPSIKYFNETDKLP